jgi:hypothetical protein
MASRYEALASYLSLHPGPTHTMSFAQIEQIIGYPLPPSAQPDHKMFRNWWANDRSQQSTHVQAKSGWLAAGWEVDSLDKNRRTVTFRK